MILYKFISIDFFTYVQTIKLNYLYKAYVTDNLLTIFLNRVLRFSFRFYVFFFSNLSFSRAIFPFFSSLFFLRICFGISFFLYEIKIFIHFIKNKNKQQQIFSYRSNMISSFWSKVLRYMSCSHFKWWCQKRETARL